MAPLSAASLSLEDALPEAHLHPERKRIRRFLLVTDAWAPQTNGVAATLGRVVEHIASKGVDVQVIAPHQHFNVPIPTYPQIRFALDPWKAMARIRAFRPDAIHVATEGTLGFWTVGWLRKMGLRFTTSFHTRYPEYLNARIPFPVAWGYRLAAWFHCQAEQTFVSARALMRELEQRGVGRRLVYWPRGVDTRLFTPEARRDDLFAALPRPIWLYVGRIAIEKSVDAFLRLPLEGTKVVVGDGPARADLQRRFPHAVWRGFRFGEELAAHYASADCFVFPSRTDTFGNVVLEALAAGLPVASVPAPGPADLLEEGATGAIDDDLMRACLRALRGSRQRARASALRHTFEASHETFRGSLVPVTPDLGAISPWEGPWLPPPAISR